MRLFFLTLFPDQMEQYFLKGIQKKALDKGLFDVSFIPLRSYSTDKHQRVDDYPFGGKKGMLLKADVIYDAVTQIPDYASYRILSLCPKGEVVHHALIRSYAQSEGLIFICGYYEGIDDRLYTLLPQIERVSIGDLVLSSGELPAMLVAEAVLRYVPGVVGKADCVEEDSFKDDLLEFPQYTQPRDIKGVSVPDVVVSGDHQAISDWRAYQQLKQTLYNRPDLLLNKELTNAEQDVIVEIFKE